MPLFAVINRPVGGPHDAPRPQGDLFQQSLMSLKDITFKSPRQGDIFQ